MAAGVLAACSQSGEKSESGVAPWQRAGWHYNFENNDDRGAAIYRFGDNSKDYFLALCDRIPIFFLKYREYDRAATSFAVDIDNRSWSFKIDHDAHSDALTIEDGRFGDYFAGAKRRIAYRVGKEWVAEIPPSPLLARFVAQCRARNEARTR